ncbi:YjcZ family sporulation protein [Sporosarcina sp. 6E9]|nr:YjcZ family sporulation protein [Sporosarcina sp. 6E9]MBO1913381.1 YjcZ family sporulation protein [Microvirga sp. 3-52]
MSSKIEKEACNVGYGAGFTLIVVLFILLIIVGAAYIGNDVEGGYGCY